MADSEKLERRVLQFDNWNAALADLESLERGYRQLAQWDLSQTARHLNDWITFPVRGFPKAGLFGGLMMGALRLTVGPGLLRKIVSEGRMKDGVPTIPETVYQPVGADDQKSELSNLRESIQRFRDYEGEIHDSPVFGAMDKSTAERLQLVHFAHHLSWLVPDDASN